MKSMIFTLVGKDKTGLVDSLAQSVFEVGGNWLASNFAHMGGHFAGFVQVDVPEDKHQELVDIFAKHPDLQINLVEGEAPDAASEDTVCIEIMGNDKPGIVQELTSVLNQFNLNIVKFASSCGSAPNWGGTLFKATATISVSADFDMDPLQDALEAIANDLVVDVHVK